MFAARTPPIVPEARLSRDLNDLAILARLAARLNFEAAARDLGLSASTVSRRIAALEARLGIPLVLRTTRSVRLTPAGAAYADHCREVVAAAERADALAQTHLEGMQGDLSVNAPTLFGRLLLAPILMDFALRHPAIRVRLTLGNARVDLTGEGIDLVVRTGELSDSTLRVQRLATVPFVVVASPACLARHGTPTTLAEVAALPCVALDRRGDTQWCTGAGSERIDVAVVFAADDVEVLRDAALAGLGFALLPRFAAARALADGRLVSLTLDRGFDPAPLSLVFPGNRVPNRCARALADTLIAALADDKSWTMANRS